MIRRACIAGIALAVIGGCNRRDEVQEVEPVEIAPGTPGEAQPYAPGAAFDDDAFDQPAERRTERAPTRDMDDRADRRSRDRETGDVASHQDLARAVEDAEVKITRLRATETLTDAEEADLDTLERRLREVQQDLDDAKDDRGDVWDETSSGLRGRLKRINRGIERIEDHEA